MQLGTTCSGVLEFHRPQTKYSSKEPSKVQQPTTWPVHGVTASVCDAALGVEILLSPDTAVLNIQPETSVRARRVSCLNEAEHLHWRGQECVLGFIKWSPSSHRSHVSMNSTRRTNLHGSAVKTRPRVQHARTHANLSYFDPCCVVVLLYERPGQTPSSLTPRKSFARTPGSGNQAYDNSGYCHERPETTGAGIRLPLSKTLNPKFLPMWRHQCVNVCVRRRWTFHMCECECEWVSNSFIVANVISLLFVPV